MRAYAFSSNTIYTSWIDIPLKSHNGELRGYHVKYKKYFETTWNIKFVDYGYTSCTLTDLKPFTLYWIDVVAVNDAGEGPPDYAIVKTLEGGKSTLFLIISRRAIVFLTHFLISIISKLYMKVATDFKGNVKMDFGKFRNNSFE